MNSFYLPDKAINFLFENLFNSNGAFSNFFDNVKLRNIRTFIGPCNYSNERLLEFDVGGIVSQNIANLYTIEDIRLCAKRNGKVLVFYDRWSEFNERDSIYFDIPVKTGSWRSHMFHLLNLDFIEKNLEYDFIKQFRLNSFSYEKIFFVSSCEFTEKTSCEDFFTTLLRNAISFYVSAYDDESFVAADLYKIN